MSEYSKYFPSSKKEQLESKNPRSSIRELIENLTEIENTKKRKKTSSVHVNKVVKSAASLYEKMRNTIDFKEEHLLRRGAIQRIMTRRLSFKQSSKDISKGIVYELVQTGYLKNDSVNKDSVKKISVIIEKYLSIIEPLDKKEQEYYLAIASAEIEEEVVSHDKEEALLLAMKKNICHDIEKNENKKVDSVQLLIAMRKVFLKSDLATLRFFLWTIHYPSWTSINADYVRLTADTKKINGIVRKIESDLKKKKNTKLTKTLKPYNPIFIIMQKIIDQKAKSVEDIFIHPQKLNNVSKNLIEEHYASIKSKLHGSIIRAVLFILVTKMVVGILVEVPYEIYFLGHLNWFTLAINLLFPPLLMFVSASLIKIPGEKNTDKLTEKIKYTVYAREKSEDIESRVKFSPSMPMTASLKVIYGLMFVIIFGLTIWLLVSLGFNIVSGFLFFFFISVVSLLALRIRLSAKDLLVVKEKEGTVSNLIDFLLLPFLRIGYWLAAKFEGVNFFLFFLDFIIEAPFKLFLEVASSWIDFVKEKKEELIG